MKFINGRQRTNLFSLIFLCLLISGCMPAVESSTQTVTSFITQTAIQSIITDTPAVSPTADIDSAPTAQPTVEISLEKDCIPIEEKMPDDLVLSGVWVRNEATPYLENLDEHVDYIVPLEGGELFSTRNGNMAISPDGKYLAYIDAYIDPTRHGTEKRILRIIKSSGHSSPMGFWTEDWQQIMSWVDNRNLAIFNAKKEVVILNPFTGKFREFQKPEWLDYDESYWGLPTYSPNLDWAIVYTDGEMSLKDVQTGEVLWKTSRNGYSSWSANSSFLKVISGESITVVTNGKQAREFGISNLGIDSSYPTILSPNGQKLVFTSYFPEKFFIFDITQLKVRELCNDELEFWNEPFWSPDNRYVVQEVHNSYYDQFDLLIDTQQLRAYKLTSGQYQHRLVWLAKP